MENNNENTGSSENNGKPENETENQQVNQVEAEKTDAQTLIKQAAEARKKAEAEKFEAYRKEADKQTDSSGSGPSNQSPAPKNWGDWWGDSEIDRPKAKPALESEVTEDGAPASPKLTPSVVNAGARTAVSTINMVQTMLMRPLLNWRFKKEAQKRLGDEAYEKGMELVMGDVVPSSPEEKSIKARFNAFLKQRDRKLQEIPFTEDEEKDMEVAFREYFKLTGKSMSPEVLLWCSLIGTMGKRAIDVLLWD